MPVRFGAYSGDPLLVERSLAERLEDFSLAERTTLFGDEVSLPQFLTELGTRSLFSADKVLVVRRADSLAKDPRFSQYLRRGLPPHTALFLLGQERLGPVERLADEAKYFPPPTGRALRELAATLLSEAGLPAHSFLVDLLTLACGGDTLRLAQEVRKLAVWQGETIPRSRLAELLFFAQSAPYALLDAVGERNTRAALSELRRLLAAGWDPHHLFFMIANYVRTLLVVQSKAHDGRQPSGPEWLVRKHLTASLRFTQGELLQLHSFLQDLDVRIKTGGATPKEALHLFILRLAP